MFFEKMKGQRTGELLIHENYLYTLHREEENGLRWRCQDRTCPGFITILHEVWITDWNSHSHVHVAAKISKLKILEEIKNRALTTTERPNDIVIREVEKIIDEDIIVTMPSLSSMRDKVKRLRNTQDGLVPGLAEDIPEILKIDSKGNPFFRFDSGIASPDRFVIFFSKLKEDYRGFIDTVLIDGTFRSTPQNFYQILVIHGYVLGNFYPLCYILLKDKTQLSYERSLSKFLELYKITPRSVVTDFELGLINGVRLVFNEAKYNGCLFHFGQAVWRRVSEDRNIKIFKKNEDFKKYIHYFMHLAFVPSEKVRDFYILIKKTIKEELFDLRSSANTLDDEIARLKKEVMEILLYFSLYFEKVWIGVLDDQYRLLKEPTYSIEFWNGYDRIVNHLPRTSNGAESWNRTLNLRSGVAHPNIAQFITELLRCEEEHKYILTRAELGIFKLSRENLVKEKNILICVQGFKIFKPFKYLDIICKLYKFKLDNDGND